MTEKQLQQAVVELAQYKGYLVYHTYDSRKSEPGFPDLTMVKQGRLIFVELKSAKGKVSPEQLVWLGALMVTNAEVYVWRPADWQSGEIERIL